MIPLERITWKCINCPLDGCTHEIPDVDADTLLFLHNNVYINANTGSSKPKKNCNQVVDFTDIMVKDVLVTKLADNNIFK